MESAASIMTPALRRTAQADDEDDDQHQVEFEPQTHGLPPLPCYFRLANAPAISGQLTLKSTPR
jgi:hypothetical protein